MLIEFSLAILLMITLFMFMIIIRNDTNNNSESYCRTWKTDPNGAERPAGANFDDEVDNGN